VETRGGAGTEVPPEVQREVAGLCRHDTQVGGVTVLGGEIFGTAPFVLPNICVKCGKEATKGRRADTTLAVYPLWIWLGLFIGVIGVAVLYLLTSKRLQISYSLCPECARTRKTKRWLAWGAWLLCFVFAGATIAAQLNKVLMVISILFFVVGLVMTIMAGSRLRATRCEGEIFTVTGVGRGFIESMRMSSGR
jgi:hypothetical protein